MIPRVPPTRPRQTTIVSTTPNLSRCLRVLLCTALLALGATGCVYRVDVQQGNLLDNKAIDAVQPGMTRSQVRFLLGTPVVEDQFHTDRWDYMYYYRAGRSSRTLQRWIIVYFDGDKVKEVRRDVPVGTAAGAAPAAPPKTPATAPPTAPAG